MDLKTIAHMADEYQEVRDSRLYLQREVDKMKEQEDILKANLITVLREQEVGGVAGSKYRVTLKTRLVPVSKDWSQVYAYIKANDAFDLLQQRLSPPAVRERQADGQVIPGIEDITQYDLGLNKL